MVAEPNPGTAEAGKFAATNGSAEGAGAFLLTWIVFLVVWSVPLIIAEYALGHDSELVRDLLTFPKAANHGLGPFIGLATTTRLTFQQWFAGREH